MATLTYSAPEAGLAGASTEIPPPRPSEDVWAHCVVMMYSNWQGWRGRKMEFEVPARQEGFSRVCMPPPPEEPRNWDVLIGSPIFVALT